MKVLGSQTSNAKLAKNTSITTAWGTSILYLAPANLADPSVNLCPGATPGCRAACLYTAGRGAMNSVQAARIKKTKRFLTNQPAFMADLVDDLDLLSKRQKKSGIRQAIRLNGTSDVRWESIKVIRNGIVFRNVFIAYPELQFYDYTKIPARVMQCHYHNYHLTYSASEVTTKRVLNSLFADTNVAIVFQGDKLPETYWGRRVIDGNAHDMRYLDDTGIIVGLLAKGKAKKDLTGFAKAI